MCITNVNPHYHHDGRNNWNHEAHLRSRISLTQLGAHYYRPRAGSASLAETKLVPLVGLGEVVERL